MNDEIQKLSGKKLLTPHNRKGSKTSPPRRITKALSTALRVGLIAPALLAASMTSQAADCTVKLIAGTQNLIVIEMGS